MTNFSERRQQAADARQAQSDQNVRDFTRGMNGWNVPSVWGQVGLANSKSMNNTMGGAAASARGSAASPGASAPSQPFLPGVDNWLKKIPAKVFLTLAAVGAICGYGYGNDTGGTQEGILDAIAFGFGGLILIPALAKLFKAAVVLLIVGAVGGIIYLLCTHS